MHRLLNTLVILLFSVDIFCQSPAIAVIPKPMHMQPGKGGFRIGAGSPITVCSADPELLRLARQYAQRLSAATGRSFPVRQVTGRPPGKGGIDLVLHAIPDSAIGDEGYRLQVKTGSVILSANSPSGIFYGMQTLTQLLPAQVESEAISPGVDWFIPAVDIIDKPRFGWRGLMLDVARHFFTKEQVKAFIDEMVRYKFNVLHLHLTDDEGWRIEIRSYPELTKKGAWNVKRVGYYGNFTPPLPEEKRDQGGFYTQDDIREIVAYAKARFVDILPEIDVPGHSLAAVVSYPTLSCTAEANTYSVRSGEMIRHWEGGHPVAWIDNTLCPANEQVYVFLDKVFGELASLFPFGYVHMGGDECATNFWEKSKAVKDLMAKEGLKDMKDVQGYFTKRVSKIIAAKGKRMVGWDEIVEGGIPENAMVMSWRDTLGGIKAAKLGHPVVMTPKSHTYLDLMQGDRIVEPFVYETLTLKTAYAFNPQPVGIDPSLVKGAQGNLWTEQIYSIRHMQYMLWPRCMALSESMWTPADQKDWGDFLRRAERHFERMDVRGVKYAKSIFDPIFKVSLDKKDSIVIDLSTEAPGLSIHYSFDNAHPDEFYPVYSSPLSIPKEAVMLKVVTSRNGKLIGRQIDMPVSELRNRAGRKGKPSEGSNAERRRLKLIILIQAAAIAVLSLIIYRKGRKNAGDAKR